jgi:hypothetical protein
MFVSVITVCLSVVFAVLFSSDVSLLNFSLLVGSMGGLILSLLYPKSSVQSHAKWMFIIFLVTNLWTPSILDNAPTQWLRPWIKFEFGTELYPNLQNKEFENVTYLYDVRSFTAAKEVMKDSYVPVIFKGLMNNSEAMGQKILQRLEADGVKLRVAVYDVDGSFDYLRGSPYTRNGDAVLSSVAMAENSPYFAAFEPFLNSEEVAEIAGEMLSKNYLFDTNFMSNFNKTVVSAGAHGAAVITSWALQMMGTKTWFLWSPKTSKAMHREWWGRTPFPSHGSEKDLFDHPTYKVVCEPGDVLAFPPFWIHAVTTHPGPNLMLNLRTMIGWVPFGGDWLCGLRIALGAPLIAIFKFLPAGKLEKANALSVDGLRKIRVDDVNVAWTETPEQLRSGPVEQYL